MTDCPASNAFLLGSRKNVCSNSYKSGEVLDMKAGYLYIGLLLFSLLAGCANTRGLSEAEQKAAIEKYPYRGWSNLQPDDGVGTVTAKVVIRVLLCPLTFGLSEVVLWEGRNETFSKYSKYLYYNGFVGKDKSYLMLREGAPTRICPDGSGGEICVYEKTFTTGGYIYTSGNNVYSTPYRLHKNIKEFYFNKNNACYFWKVRTE